MYRNLVIKVAQGELTFVMLTTRISRIVTEDKVLMPTIDNIEDIVTRGNRHFIRRDDKF